jgi:transposase
MITHKLTSAQQQEVRAAIANGESFTAIGKRYGITRASVYYYAEKIGLKSSYMKQKTPNAVLALIPDMCAEGKSMRQIADTLNIAYSVVEDYIRTHKIKHINTKPPTLCKVWHARLKENDPESIFTDPDFIAAISKQAVRCYDYKRMKKAEADVPNEEGV